MANPITTAASFATLNMKPQPDEQIDALWGQNVADNTGYLFYKQKYLPQIGNNHANQLYTFQKEASHNGLKVVCWDGTGSQAVTMYMRVFDGGTSLSWNTSGGNLIATITRNQTSLAFSRFDMDISSLSNGSYYTFTFWDGNPTVTTFSQVWLTYGSGASY